MELKIKRIRYAVYSIQKLFFVLFLLSFSEVYSQTISITKSHTGTLKAGDVIAYTVTATNNTTSVMTGVSISDPVPGTPAVFVPNSLTVGGTSLTCSVPATITNAILISGFNLLPGESLVYSFMIKVPANFSGTGTVAHTANLNAGAATASTSNSISAIPALSVVKTGITDVSPGSVNKTGLIRYMLTVSNTGTATANSTVIRDALDITKVDIAANNSVVVAQNYNGSFVVNKGNTTTHDSIRVTLGDIPAGGITTIQFTVRVKPAAIGSVTNTASALSSNLTGGLSSGTVNSNTTSHTINAGADCSNRNIYFLSFTGSDASAEINNPNRPWQTFFGVITAINAAGGNAILRFQDAYYPTSVSGSTAPTLSTNCVTIDGNYCIFDRNSGASVGFLNVEGQNDTIRNLRLTNFNKSPDCSFNITGTPATPILGFQMDDVKVFGTLQVKATTFTNVEWAEIKNCEWSNNPNGGLDITDSKINFINSTFSCNYRPGATGGDGGAIYAVTTGTSPQTNKTILKFSGCSFYDNRAFGLAGDGGAIYCGDNVTLNLTNSNFLSNYSDGPTGGAIRLNLSSNTLISGCKFRRNYCSAPGRAGGAIYVSGTSGIPTSYPYLTILNSEFDENWASAGGGIHASSCNLKLRGNYFQRNVANSGTSLPASGSGAGAAIYLSEHSYTNFNFVHLTGANPNVTPPPALPGNTQVQYMGTDSTMWVYNGTTYIRQLAAVRDSFVNNILADNPNLNIGGSAIYTGDVNGSSQNLGVNLYGTGNSIPSRIFANLGVSSSVTGNGHLNDWTEWNLFNQPTDLSGYTLGNTQLAPASGTTTITGNSLQINMPNGSGSGVRYATTTSLFSNLASGNIKGWAINLGQSSPNTARRTFFILSCSESNPASPTASGYAVRFRFGTSIELVRFSGGITAATSPTIIQIGSAFSYTGFGPLALLVTFNPTSKEFKFYYSDNSSITGFGRDPRPVKTSTIGVGANPGGTYAANATVAVSGVDDITGTSLPFTGFLLASTATSNAVTTVDDFWMGEFSAPVTAYAYTEPAIPASCPVNPTSTSNCITFSDIGKISLSGCKFMNTYTGDFAASTPVQLQPGQTMTAIVSNFFPVNSPANVYQWRYLVVNPSGVIVQVVTPASHTNVTNTPITPSFSPVVSGTYSVYGYYFNSVSTTAPTPGTTLVALMLNECGSLSNNAATFVVLNPIVETITASCAQNGINSCPDRYFGTVSITGGYPEYASINGLTVPPYIIGADKTYVPAAYTNEMTGWVEYGVPANYINSYIPGNSFGVKTEDDGNCTTYPILSLWI